MATRTFLLNLRNSCSNARNLTTRTSTLCSASSDSSKEAELNAVTHTGQIATILASFRPAARLLRGLQNSGLANIVHSDIGVQLSRTLTTHIEIENFDLAPLPVFDSNDYRNVRFTNATRHVNPNWGINLIDEIPPKECTERVVYCDGGDGPLGHPKVYINLDKPGAHACGYCGLRFVKKDDHHH